ncbi:hypothetical protein GALL_485340 [mine drainage metagenome]|uniref:Uncharacterized protein n=1 Tax=mine drainage metagenome TaxID=410659 RepID=A0A1J5Q1W7_9ZZZZ
MAAAAPAGGCVASQTQCAITGVHANELRVPVFVRVMATGALHFVILVELDGSGQTGRVNQLTLGRGQRTVVQERYRMIGRQIGAQGSFAGQHTQRWLHTIL